jgi:hypothetical protein
MITYHHLCLGFLKLAMLRFLQVRDYRKAFDQGASDPSTNGSPVVNKVCLKMSLENVVKDIPLISDNSWTYGDLMVSMINSSHPWVLNFCLVLGY